MSEELRELITLSSIWTGKKSALEFFEKRLGSTNKYVIDYRLSIKNDFDKMIEAQKEFRDTEYFKSLPLKETN